MGIALPIIGGMVSQNIMNLVDTAMVGSLGKEALAAVGLASFATILSQAFLTGLSSGVQTMAARRKGEGKLSELAMPLNGGLACALLLGIPTAAVIWMLAPYLFGFLNDDPEVVKLGVPYWRIRLFAITGVAMNFSFRGYLNGVNLSKLYMRTLIVMHVANISMNYVLIFGKFGFPKMGVEGAALGTAIATFLGTATYITLALKHARHAGFLRSLPDAATMRTLLRLSIPAGAQQMFFIAGYTALFWIIGKVGTAELAAASVVLNLMLVGLLPGMGLGLASASLVGQALGRDNPKDARQWGWDVAKCAVVVLLAVGVPMTIGAEPLLSLFIRGEPDTLKIAILPLQLSMMILPLDAVGMVLMNSLLGAGNTSRVAMISIGFQWLIFLPVAYLLGPVFGGGLLAIWAAQGVYRLIQAGVFASLWKADGWTAIRV